MSNSQEYSGLTPMQLAMVRSTVHDDKLNIIDCDAHFTVDTINKIIVNADKRKFVQFSHNSERVTFDCDRYIEGHDITECNVKQIHYLEDGIYDIDDLTINEDDDTKVTFSWLISGNVTKDVLKSVPFSLILECVREDGVCTYSWDTEENTSLYVVKGRRNTQHVAYQYADILEQWRRKLLSAGGGVSEEQLARAVKEHVPTCIRKYNANDYGVLPTNEPLTNSQNLQALIDSLTENGGTIYIPKGTYRFGSNVKTLFAESCIELKSNVSIVGDGSITILKPVGNTADGLDLFHYDGVLDGSEAVYLENCKFEDFVIDGEEACLTGTYTAFGKGIMASPIKRCYFNRLIVKNTDGTGIGVDCPVDCYIRDCSTYNCGKAGEVRCGGASGIGIGFGYAENENMVISNCRCDQNKMFGIFFEHQRRFGEYTFTATKNKGFVVENCTCYGNNYNFGGLQADNVMFRDCYSREAKEHGFFLENSKNCSCMGCYSVAETNTSFVVLCIADNEKTVNINDDSFINCISKATNYGCKIVNANGGATVERIMVKDCFFNLSMTEAIRTSGNIGSIVLHGNVSNGATNSLGASVTNLINLHNTWNS